MRFWLEIILYATRLRIRAVLPFLLMVIIGVLLGLTAIQRIFYLDNLTQKIPLQTGKILNVKDLKYTLLAEHNNLNAYLQTGDKEYLKNFRILSKENKKSLEELYQIIRPQRKELVKTVIGKHNYYLGICERDIIPKAKAAFSQNQNYRACELAKEYNLQIILARQISCAEKIEILRLKDTRRLIETTAATTQSYIKQAVASVVTGLLLGIIIAAAFSPKILRENSIYQFIINNTRRALLVLDKKERIVFLNPKAEELFGLKKHEILGKPLYHAFTEVLKKEEVEKIFPVKEVLVKGKGICNLEKEFVDKEGWSSNLKLDILPLKNNKTYGVILFIQDITEEKVIEERLRGMAIRDSLTMLFNHSYLKKILCQEIEKIRNTTSTLAFMLLDIDHFKYYNDAFGHLSGDELLKTLARLLEKSLRDTDILGRYGGDEFGIILPNANAQIAQDIGERLRQVVEKYPFPHREEVPGGAITVSIGVAIFPHDSTQGLELVRLADEALYNAKRKARNRVEIYFSAFKSLQSEFQEQGEILSSIKTLLAVVNARDRYTYGHSERVAELVELMARKMNLGQKEIKELRLAAFLHDLGKIDINAEILNKPGSLTEEEWQHIKEHPEIGAAIIREFEPLVYAIPAVLYHHERFDGRGYPFGLKGEEIPLIARLIAVADSFDAMTTERPYKRAKTKKEALAELKRGAGTQFDPQIVNMFINIKE